MSNMSKTPKSDQLRALREAQFKRQQMQRAGISDVEEVVSPDRTVVVKRLLKEVVLPANAKPFTVDGSGANKRGRPKKTAQGFDKTAYQRDYMRKHRAAKEPT